MLFHFGSCTEVSDRKLESTGDLEMMRDVVTGLVLVLGRSVCV